MNIILIGFRGSGKSCVGRELAARLRLSFVDTDKEVERLAGKTIAEIFESEGEARFREFEKQAMLEACRRQRQVIAVGGGAVENGELAAAMKRAGVVVLLTAPAEVLHERIERDEKTPMSRPALTGSTGLTEVKKLLTRRHKAYHSTADLTIDTTTLTPAELAQELENELKKGAASKRISPDLA